MRSSPVCSRRPWRWPSLAAAMSPPALASRGVICRSTGATAPQPPTLSVTESRSHAWRGARAAGLEAPGDGIGVRHCGRGPRAGAQLHGVPGHGRQLAGEGVVYFVATTVDGGAAWALRRATPGFSSFGTEAAELRDKQRVIEDVVANLDAATVRAEVLLRSVEDLLLMWDLLDPQERRERLMQLVSGLWLTESGPGGTRTRRQFTAQGCLAIKMPPDASCRCRSPRT